MSASPRSSSRFTPAEMSELRQKGPKALPGRTSKIGSGILSELTQRIRAPQSTDERDGGKALDKGG